MESTQVIRWDAEEEAETELSSVSLGYSLEPVGRLRLFSGTHGPERDFPLYLGKNVVGRSPDCSVALPFPSVSKQHAVIEISAWNKAPVLQDCGSLNGTQIVRPPRVLTPGVSHRLRDQELILFADFPCQYRRLDVPPPLVPRRLLVEKTPRVQGGPQTAGVSLAEDSEEEVDSSGRCVANGSRNTSSPSVTVVPESDEEDFSPAPSAPGPSLPFDLGSDTDEEQDQQPGVGVSSLAPRNGAPGEAEQPEAHGMSTGIQLVQAQTTEQKCKDIKIKSEAGNGVALAGSILEKSPTLGEDSDTDVEEETPPVLPVTKQVLGTRDSRAPGEARLQDSPSGSDANVEGKTVPAVPPERSHTAMVINSDTEEEEEEVSGALTLARLKERGIALWSRDPSMEEVKSQPQVLVERSESVSGRDSDTDVEEGLSGEKRKVVPDSPMDVDEAPVITRAESQPPHGPSDVDEDMDMSSPGSHLQGNQSSSAVGDKSAVKVEEEVPPEPSVTPGEKHQVPLEEARETAVEEGSSLAGAGVSRSQQPGAQEAGTEWAAAVSEQEHALEVGVQSRSPAAPMEQVAVDTDNSGSPTLPHREIAQTVKAKDCCDEPEDLCLPATQCFVERESQNPEAVQSLEDEPTQVFPCTLPQEPGPSHLSLETPGPGTLDAPWEVLATQPFCLREQTEASEPQLTAAHPEAHGSHPSLPRAPPGHLVHTELLRIEGREIQTVEKAMGIPKETAGRVTPERGPLERKTRGRTHSEPEDEMGEEELAEGRQDREPKTVLAGDRQRQEAHRVEDGSPEGSRESLKVETEMSKDSWKEEKEVEMPEPERGGEPAGLEETLDRGVTGQKGQIASLTRKPGVEVRDHEGLVSALIIFGSQGDGGRGDPLSPGRQQRGHLSCQTSSAGKASRGDAEPVPQRLLSPVPEASAPPQSLLTSQSQKQPPLSASSPSELQLPEALHSKPSARPRRSSRTAARPTDQPAAPRPTSRGRASRSSTRTPELNVPTDPELQPPTSTEQLVTPNATPEATPHRSSIKTPESLIPTGPELQPPTSTEQSVVPKPTSRGRPRKSTIRTPESIAPTGPELQPLTSTEQPVIPKPRATCGRPSKSSIRTPEPVVPTGPELQPPTSTEQPVTLNLKSQTSRGRPSKFIRTPEPVVPTGPELQPPTSTEQPVTPEPSFQVKTRKSSVRTPEASIPTTPKLQPCTSKEQHAPTPRARGTRGRTRKSCTEESESAGPVAPDFEPPTYTDHLTTSPEATTGQSITLQSSPLNVSSVSTTQPSVPTAQPVPLETVPQGSHQRRRRAARKQGSHTGPVGHKAYSASSELEPQSSASQSSGASEAAESNTTTLEPAISLDQKEVGRRSRLIPKTQPEASQVRKKPSSTTDSPLQKRPARQVPQKTVIKEESPAEEAPVKEEPQERAVTAPGKRKRDHAEDESQGNPNRGRRSKPNQEAAVPKVLFTGVTDSRGERAVLALGGSLASSVNEASHLVTDRIRRTVKFLCALGKGIPILSLNWLYQSRKAGCFLPPDKYLVIDPEQEKNFSFSLRDSLSRARERRLLEGYEIHVTPGVQPPPPQMGEIISCCGGTVLPSMPRSYKPHRVIITCPEDLARCTVPSQLGLPLLSPEFLLTGVLKQEATPEAFVLFKLEMSSN